MEIEGRIRLSRLSEGEKFGIFGSHELLEGVIQGVVVEHFPSVADEHTVGIFKAKRREIGKDIWNKIDKS